MSFVIEGGGDFCPVATLAASVSYFDTRFSIRDLVITEGEKLYPGMVAMIDEEIVRVTQVGAGYVDVARGCSDTIPAPHYDTADIWFYSDNVGIDMKEYAAGESLIIKPLPRLFTGELLPLEDSPPKHLTMNYRFSRPYPPGLMLSNGTPWFQSVALSAMNPNMVLTWTHRDRIIQEDKQIDHFVQSIGPEPGTTYIAKIYNDSDQLVHTEIGIVGTTWTYTWEKAMMHLGLVTQPAGSEFARDYMAKMEFTSYRDNLEGWQAYSLPFSVNNEAPYIMMAQMSEIVAQPDSFTTDGSEPPVESGMFVTTSAEMTLQEADSGTGTELAPSGGMFLTASYENVSQPTSLYTWMNRALFEAPYTFLLRRVGNVPSPGRVVTVVARPSDRLTDTHKIHSREKADADSPQSQYEYKDSPPFTPWLIIDSALDYLTNTVSIRTTSLYDGVALSEVRSGQMAMIGSEIVGVISVTGSTVTVARGCVDTVPSKHSAGSRIWFFEAGCGFDPTSFRQPPVLRTGTSDKWVHLEYKMVPDVFGPDLPLADVPTDRLTMRLRNHRPFPPGQLLVNGKHWFQGHQIEPDRSTIFSWVQRNRVTQERNVIDHTAPNIPHEAGTRYRFKIEISVRTPGATTSTRVIVREDYATGTRYEYTYAMAMADGYRVARAMSASLGYSVCGAVSVSMMIDAVRDELENWQGYQVMLRLPAPKCAIGPAGPIGGPVTIPPWPGYGNGTIGGYDPGDGTSSPITGGSTNPDGGGSKPPDPIPPDWPDPLVPNYPTDPTDPNAPTDPTDPGYPTEPPEGIGYWDYRWDTFWAATGTESGGTNPGDGYDPGGTDTTPTGGTV